MNKWLRIAMAIITLLAAARKVKPPVVEPEPPVIDESPTVEPQIEPPAPPRVTRMIDVSNFWLPGVATDEDAVRYMTAAKAEGYAGVCALALWPSLTHQQMWAAREAGMFSDMYVFPDWTGGVDQSIPVRRVKASWEAPCWVWIDLEDQELAGVDVHLVVNVLFDELREAGYQVGIYTNRYWWNTFMPDYFGSAFGPLWLADPDGTEELEDWVEGWGGWDRPTWNQYAFNQNVAGMNVDLNVWSL